MVAADAGFGKTTLIADFVRSQSRPAGWYQLDLTDADPVVFSRLGNKVYVNFYTEKTDLNRKDNLYQVWLSFCDDRLIAFAVQKYS